MRQPQRFQGCALANNNKPPVRMDEVLAFEDVQRFGDAGAAHSEHGRHILVGKLDLFPIHTIVAHQFHFANRTSIFCPAFESAVWATFAKKP
jgi:hypothetical protein